jgi:UDP-N-acetylmuramoyl-tripeptide--D-alanyl-D-alanine ligase
MKKILINIFLWYLRTAARIQLLKIRPKIIALTGSMGKTSLRNAVFAVLKDNFRVKKSVKANSETGLPLDILGLHPQDYSFFDWLKLGLLIPLKILTNWQKYDYYIAELGVDEPLPPKNMEYLLSFIHPDIAIFLNVAAVHTQQFEKIIPKNKKFISDKEQEEFLTKAIATEKGKIITFLPADKIAIVNSDDPLVMGQTKKARAQILSFGEQKSNNLQFTTYSLQLSGTEFTYRYQNKEFTLEFPYLLPQYYAHTFAAAILTGVHLGLNLQLITHNLQLNFVLPPGRMSVFRGIKNTTIIDSSYNASKIPTLGVLDLLVKLKTSSKKVFVFGDMRELGNQAKSEHEAVAKEILKTVDQLVLIGPLTQRYVLPLTKDKLPTHWFPNSWQAADWLKNNLKDNEIVLVKGSQNTIFTEIVVEALLENKSDVAKLCRRGEFWDRQRKKLLYSEIQV